MRKLAMLLLMCFVVAGSLGCRSNPQMLTPTMDITNYKVTAEQVKKTIIEECNALGWNAKAKDANTIVATILVRNKHHVVVDIPYTASSYSIKYVSSRNMDASGSSIHSSYNKWVNNLNNAINDKLSFQRM